MQLCELLSKNNLLISDAKYRFKKFIVNIGTRKKPTLLICDVE